MGKKNDDIRALEYLLTYTAREAKRLDIHMAHYLLEMAILDVQNNSREIPRYPYVVQKQEDQKS